MSPPRARHVDHAAVDDGTGVVAARAQDAGRDRGPGAAFADRHHRSVGGEVGAARRQQPVGDVAAAGDVARVALVLLAHVDHLGAGRDQRLELVDGDRRRCARRRRRGRTRRRRRRRPSGGRGSRARPRRRSPRARRPARPASSTNPAFVAKLVPETGTLTAPGRWPARCAPTGRTSRSCASCRRCGELLRERRRPANGPRLASTMRARFGGFGALIAAESAMNSSTSVSCRVGLKRRSKPIVVDGFELIDLPQSEPATWPGNTSTPSASSSSRRSEWKSPSAPSSGADREVGPRGIADEERVAGEHEPRLVAARAVDRR